MRHLKPREIQGCQLALDASIATSLYDATSGGSLVAADGAVARWEDQSGNGLHFIQESAGNRPIRKIEAADTLYTSNVGHGIYCGASTLLQNITHAVLLSVVQSDNFTASAEFLSIRCGGGGPTRGVLEIAATTGYPSAGGRRLDGDSFTGADGTSATPLGTKSVQVGVIDHTSGGRTLRRNASQIATATAASTGTSSNTASGATGIFHNFSRINGIVGRIGCAIVYHGNPGMSSIRRLEHAAMRKWRING